MSDNLICPNCGATDLEIETDFDGLEWVPSGIACPCGVKWTPRGVAL